MIILASVSTKVQLHCSYLWLRLSVHNSIIWLALLEQQLDILGNVLIIFFPTETRMMSLSHLQVFWCDVNNPEGSGLHILYP